MNKLIKNFKNPSKEYTMNFLLRMNDDIPKEELSWQLKQMEHRGIKGIFFYFERVNLFTEGSSEQDFREMDVGIKIKYLSKEYWKLFDFVFQECKKLKMNLWLYDEEDWPSGNAGQNGGKVTKGRPDLIGRPLIQEEIPVKKAAGKIKKLLKNAVFACVYAKSGGRITDGSIKEIRSGKDLNGIDNNLSLAVYKPGPKYGLDADVLNKDAMKRFMKYTHKQYEKRYKKYFGGVIPGIFTDEPNIRRIIHKFSGIAWTGALPKTFIQKKGYDIRPFFPLLFNEGGSATPKVRNDFWQVVNEMFIESYFKPIYEWGEKANIQTTGHLLGEEYFFDTVSYMANSYSIQKYFHIPGIDWVVPLKEPLYPWCPKMAASVGHLLNRKRVFSETFAGCGWGMDLGFMRYMVNKQYVFGVNLLTSISAKISLRGMERAKFWPGGLMVQQPYWEHVKVFADYVSRLSYLNSSGKHICSVAVLFPITEIWAKSLNKEIMDEYEKIFVKLTDSLLENQVDFDILDDAAVCEAKIKDGKLFTTTESFKILIVPFMKTVKIETLQKLVEFKKSGGTVIFSGCLPDSSPDNGKCDETVKLLAGNFKPVKITELIKEIFKYIIPDLSADPKDGIHYQYRVSGKTHYFMIVNSYNRERRVELIFNRKDCPKVFDPETGSERSPEKVFLKKGKAGVKITLGPYDVIYVFFEGSKIRPADNDSPVIKVINITGKWKFKSKAVLLNPHLAWNFENIDRGNGFPAEIGLGQWKDYGSPYFSGKGIYEKELVIEKIFKGRKIILDLGDVGLTAKVLVNGRKAGVKVWKPFRYDISCCVKAGKNILRIEVCNSLIEHYSQYKELHGKHPGAGGVIKKQLKAGLIGPVKILIY